jgi:uncharacterized protein YodC (DUF2158 family)
VKSKEKKIKMAFNGNMANDEAYVNGIGRFEIQVNDAASEVTWSQNGKAIPADASIVKFERVAQGTMRALIVKNCTKADFCKYTAECNGEKKEATLAQASPFVSKIADVQGYQGDIAVFECRVKPGSYVSWSQNGKKINKADFSILKFEERTVGDRAMLIIKNIVKSDYCKYSAEAKGEKCEAKLTEMSPFVGKMDAVAGLAGDIEVFMVQVQPATHVSWFKGSKKITKQEFSILKYEERWSGNFRELIVKNISQGDCGDYSVEARGAKQSAKLSIVKDKNQTTSALRAKAGPRKEIAPTAAKAVGRGAPKMMVTAAENTDAFATCPKSVNGKDAGIEVFECVMKDASAECKWFKGSQEINSANFSILKYETVANGANRKLIVKNIRRQDVGEYSAKSGESKVTVKLTVGAQSSSGSALTVGDLGLKRRGSFAGDRSKEGAILAALEKAKASNKKWIRHPNYLNLWIMNPDYVAA